MADTLSFTAKVDTHSGPTLGGPNTGSTVGGALLGSPGKNITKLGTILPLSCHALLPLPGTLQQFLLTQGDFISLVMITFNHYCHMFKRKKKHQ